MISIKQKQDEAQELVECDFESVSVQARLKSGLVIEAELEGGSDVEASIVAAMNQRARDLVFAGTTPEEFEIEITNLPGRTQTKGWVMSILWWGLGDNYPKEWDSVYRKWKHAYGNGRSASATERDTLLLALGASAKFIKDECGQLDRKIKIKSVTESKEGCDGD